MRSVHATAHYDRAIAAVAGLLTRLRLSYAFVGSVARSAWLGSLVDRGSVDVMALMNPEQKNQVATMAANRGFRVDRDELDRAEELDVIPLGFSDAEGEIRVHILLASNALYGRMVAAAALSGTLPVAGAEDLAMLFALGEDEESHRTATMLSHLPEFNREAYNQRLVSIGLSQHVINS